MADVEEETNNEIVSELYIDLLKDSLAATQLFGLSADDYIHQGIY